MKRRAWIKLVGGGVVLAAAAPLLRDYAESVPEAAIAAWAPPKAEGDIRKWMLSYAILAPHAHNLQSWLVDLRQVNQITLYCDLKRLLAQTDPYARQILISHGTFIEVLDLAARECGLRMDVSLFPEGQFSAHSIDHRAVARFSFSPNQSVQKDPLFRQVLKRRTNRERYTTAPISADVRSQIALSAGLEAAATPPDRRKLIYSGFVDEGSRLESRLGVTDKHNAMLTQLRTIAKDAWKIELTTPRTLLESYRLLRVGPEEIAQHRDGISVSKIIPRLLLELGLFDRAKAPAAGDAGIASQLSDFNAKIDSTPAFFWLVSEGNDRIMQINVGRAYVRAQLAASAAGVSMHPVSQALQEYPEQALPFAQIHRLLCQASPHLRVQMLCRMGYAPEIGPAPRRGLSAHLIAA
jgi:hypothetical protein